MTLFIKKVLAKTGWKSCILNVLSRSLPQDVFCNATKVTARLRRLKRLFNTIINSLSKLRGRLLLPIVLRMYANVPIVS